MQEANSGSTIDSAAHALRFIDELAGNDLREIERLIVVAASQGLAAHAAEALDSVQFIAQRLANDINAAAEAVGANRRQMA